MDAIEHILTVRNEAGESPRWDSASQTLYWADIVDPHICRWSPAGGEHARQSK
jgi:sugar lactone lactonase YvrE